MCFVFDMAYVKKKYHGLKQSVSYNVYTTSHSRVVSAVGGRVTHVGPGTQRVVDEDAALIGKLEGYLGDMMKIGVS